MRLLLIGAAIGAMVGPAWAFQETTVGGSQGNAPAAQAAPPVSVQAPAAPLGSLDNAGKPQLDQGKGVSLTMPELSLGKSSGTEVRIPGLGTVGVLPKLDFGLELLYGANENKAVPDERSEPNDLQIRGTIKHRF